MPYWYYEKKELKHTPSVNQGLSLEDETMYRREGARFILQLGNKMGLRYETMATGVVYFHRFYMVHTFQEFPRHVTACCCLFLAGKVEETPKKCKDIMRHARSLVDDATWAEFGTDPREEVMTLERILLQTIKFDFIVDHPYTYLLKYAKCLKGDKKKLQSMVQMAWTFVNDGLCTTLCLQWEPEIIAIALMYLAGKLNKFEVVDWQGRTSKHQKWWDMFVLGISMDLLEDICHQVLDLYSPNKTESSGTSSSALTSVGASINISSTSGSGSSNTSSAEVLSSSTAAPQAPLPQKSSSEGSKASQSVAPPPAKKIKKEDHKSTVSPAKTEASVTQTASYSYQYQYPNFPPPYPPPPSTSSTVSAPPPRFPYPYPPSSTQHPAPPPPQNTAPPHPAPPPPSSYQTPPSRYSQNLSSTTTSSIPSHPPPHYNVQAPPTPHYSGSHPPPYPPPSTPSPHYPPPPTTPHRPPPSHYSSHSGAPSSSYYPSSAQPSASSLPPSYQQSSSGNYTSHPSSGTYAHTPSSRQYYPPST
ncbi:UNVERIFIED_CONTAM: hypothetical protein RMT77_009278 [Armadillidium vulgare]